MKKLFPVLISLCVLSSLISCGKSNSSSSANGTNANNPQITGGRAPLIGANVTGGCRIRLVTPSEGETIDLQNGKAYEFAWTTDGSDCETPYTLYAAGNPANVNTGENILSAKFSAVSGQISRKGGYIYVTYQDLAALKSVDGEYQWCVMGYYGSHPASQTFKVIH